jgi:inhibitor of KinA sporulation pathway (predicted exonuclease)
VVVARRLDQIVVIDVEATCWEGPPPEGQESEIIEIGICTLDVASGRRLERQSILVRPERSTVSPFCATLTTLTQEQADAGMNFAEGCALLQHAYRTRNRLWASYGDYDRRQFERQCAATGTPYPFGASHLNVKSLFAVMRGLRHEIGMEEALRLLDLPLDGTHHRAGDDAWNIGGVLAALIMAGRERA